MGTMLNWVNHPVFYLYAAPSGRVVNTSYDSAARINGISGSNTSLGEATRQYMSQVSYAAHGAMKSVQLGNGKWEHANFNTRLQPTQIGLGTSATNSSLLQLDFTYGVRVSNVLDTTKNNGNLESQTMTISASGWSVVQSYTYDQVNRLSQVSESGSTQPWQQSYLYDLYGNRAVSASSYIPSARQTVVANSLNDFPSLFGQSSNRIIATSDYHYDGAGNLDKQPNVAAGFDQMSYDGENRQVNYTKGGQTTSYFYDGDGRRVKKQNPDNSIVVFVYNVAGQLIAEYDSNTTASAQPYQTSYLTTDSLGSTRMVTKSDGTVKARYDYLPFGEEIGSGVDGRTAGQGYGGADTTRQKFTSKEHDTESTLDYFGARYYSSSLGRFTSSDPIALTERRLHDPQQINNYTYVRNNPLVLIDPNGEDWITTTVMSYSFTIEREGKDNKGRTWRFSVKLTVTERTTTRKDDEGNILLTHTTATATAENTDRAINLLSDSQLETVGRVASTIAETAANSTFDRNAGFAIAQRETFFGANPPGSSSPYMNPAINPMQLTPNQFSRAFFSPQPSSTDLQHNIIIAFLLFAKKHQGRSLESAFQAYGPGAANPGGSEYGADVASKYNGINAQIGGSIRTTNFLPRYVLGR